MSWIRGRHVADAMRKMTEYLGFNTAQEYDDDGWDEDLGDQPEEIQLRIGSLRPRNYNEAITIGEHFREGSPVIMDLTDMADEDAKRLVDFAAGLTFGTRGGIQRITGKLFLLTPPGVTVIDHR